MLKLKGVDYLHFLFFDEEADTTVPVQLDEQYIDPQELEFYMDDTIRKVWDSQSEEWYFSLIDVIGFLTDSENGRKYWNKLKQRLIAEGNETVTNCHHMYHDNIIYTPREPMGRYASCRILKKGAGANGYLF